MNLKEYSELIAAEFGFPLKYNYTLMETVMTVYDETVLGVLHGDLRYYMDMLELEHIQDEFPSAVQAIYDIDKYNSLDLVTTPYMYKVWF